MTNRGFRHQVGPQRVSDGEAKGRADDMARARLDDDSLDKALDDFTNKSPAPIMKEIP